jgi:acyl-CoA synthetase (AMP-forming)/AMP-acid ligase II
VTAQQRRLTVLLHEHGSEPHDPIVHAGARTTTRAELESLVAAVRARLDEQVASGARVGVLVPNRAEAIAAWFAIWSLGATVVPLNPRSPATEIERAAEAAAVRFVVTLPELVDRVPAPHEPRFDAPLAGVALDRDAVRAGSPPQAFAVDDVPALVQFTSGTTGRPKPVPLRHETILTLLDPVIESIRGSARRGASGAAERRRPMPNLIPVSLSLWAGIYNVLFAFRVGAAVVLMDRFDPREFATLVARHGITSSVLPPAALVMLTDDERVRSLAPLKYVRSVSAPLSPYQARRFHDRFGVGVLNGYGQTELGGEAVGWTAADWRTFGESKLGSVGRPHASMRLRVRDEHGKVLAPGALGELEIRPVSGLPEGAEALAGRVTDDGWLRTGDLASIDDDGFVWVEGRVSAMINRGGLKVFPDEVEEVLRAHPTVGEAGVVGVPDDRLGEVPVAFVVPAPGHTVDRDTADALVAWCRERLAPYKVPIAVESLDSLPRNEMGKLLRAPLVERWQCEHDDASRG